MLEVRFRRNGEARLCSIAASGHAGWADAGADIVCAAVAALLQGAWLGLTDYAHVEVDGRRTKGELSLRWSETDGERDDVAAIAGTAELAVMQIARQYPDHVRYLAEAETGRDAS